MSLDLALQLSVFFIDYGASSSFVAQDSWTIFCYNLQNLRDIFTSIHTDLAKVRPTAAAIVVNVRSTLVYTVRTNEALKDTVQSHTNILEAISVTLTANTAEIKSSSDKIDAVKAEAASLVL